MPIQGFSRFRKWQFGKQSALGTGATATRRIPFRGSLAVDPNWTDQDEVDVGSIDPVLPAYRTATDITAGLTATLDFNHLPMLLSGGLIGGVSGSAVGGGAYTWTHTGESLTATTLDYFTAEWADDVDTDGYKAIDGIVESLEFGFEDDLGPWTVSADWRFGSVDHGVTPTAALNVSSNLPLLFGADTALYIDDTSGGIGGTQIVDALHSATIRINNTIDVKRFANGSNGRFSVDGYGLSEREIMVTFTFAKADVIVAALDSEVTDWLNASPTERYVNMVVTSTENAESGTPYSWDVKFSGTWRTRDDGEFGGNSTVTLEMKGRYDAALGYPIKSVVTNTLATLP